MKKWFLNLKISRKITSGFLVLSLVAAIVGTIAIVSLLNAKTTGINLKHDADEMQYAGTAGFDFQQYRYNVLKTFTLEKPSDISDNLIKIQSFKTDTLKNLDNLKNIIKPNETDMHSTLDAINTSLKGYNSYLNQFLNEYNSGNIENAKDIAYNKMSSTATDIRTSFMSLMGFASANVATSANNNSNTIQNSMIALIFIFIAAIMLTFILGSFVSRIIGKPLVIITKMAGALTEGDIVMDGIMDDKTNHLKYQKDEVGHLAAAFDNLIIMTTKQVEALQGLATGDLTTEFRPASAKDQLGQSLIDLSKSMNDLIGSISLASEQVASGANLVSNSSISLAQGVSEQASSVQELSASIEEIAMQTTKNANNAQTASELVYDAGIDAKKGNNQMKNMLHAMEEINNSSESINKIIKVIDDIAFQTNILALNAAVEAARAGQYGKGFAVVAEEVRTLAAKSAKAAKETTNLIEDSIKKVEYGTMIANETANSFSNIVSQVVNANNLVGNIANASKEQAIAIEQVNLGIIQVSQVIQNSAAISEESAAASEELSNQASNLKEKTSFFNVKQTNSNMIVSGINHNDHSCFRNLHGTAKSSITLGDFGKY